jgi:hypothetical protein
MNRPPKPALQAFTQSLRAAWQTSPLLLLGLLFTTMATLLPIWSVHYLPLLDYPGHLANLFVWRHLHDPQLGYSQYYELNLQPLPYWVQYGLTYLFAIPFGEEVAQKLFLSLAIALLPATVALYAKQLGRDPWLGVLAFPLAWNMNVSHGFLAYVGGLPLLFLSLWALDRFATAPSVFRGLLTLALGVSLYFSHILIWGAFLFVGAVVVLLSCRPFSLRRLFLGELPLLPVGLIGVWAQQHGNADQTNLPVSGKGLSAYEGVYNDFFANLGMLRGWTMNTIPESRDEGLYSAIWLALFALLVLSGWFENPVQSPSLNTEGLAPRKVGVVDRLLHYVGKAELGLLIVAILYFTLPRSLLKPFYWFAINRRLAVMVALFALLLIRGPLLRSTLRKVVLLAAMALSVLYTLDLSAHWVRFNRRNHAFDDLMAHVPKRKQVLPLMLAPGDPDSLMNCFNQWGSYLLIRQGGYMTPFFPVEFPLKRRRVTTPQSPSWDAPQQFAFSQHAAGWDYFLVHGPSRVQVFAGAEQKVRLIDRKGDWALYQKITAEP